MIEGDRDRRFGGRRLARLLGPAGAWLWLAAGADHVALMIRTADPADPGLPAFRDLAAALSELLAASG